MLNRDDIQAEYEARKYGKGWTFMACPEARMRTAAVALVGTNPGGGGPKDDWVYGGTWDVPGGNSYYNEEWKEGGGKTPLQHQIAHWHDLLEIGQDDSFCANFVPFRSRGWDDLPHKTEALAFARRLWAPVLAASPANLFVTMGKVPAWHLAEMMGARHVATLLPGWKRQTIDVYDSADGRRIVAMPHPSRFQLFGRGEDSALAEEGFKAATDRS